MAEPLVTDRLIVASLHAGDAAAMHPVLSSPELYAFTGGSPPSLDELERRYAAQVAGSSDPNEQWLNWIVHLREDGAAIGFVQATVEGQVAQIAWLIGVCWQGQGYATEATRAMCQWLLAQGVARLEAHVHPEHLASARIAEVAGLTSTGTLDSDGELIWSSA